MRTYMIYLLLTGKRLLRQLPYFLAGLAVMVLEFDQPVPEQLLAQLRAQEDVRSVTYLEMEGP